jgi:hypothetical protein
VGIQLNNAKRPEDRAVLPDTSLKPRGSSCRFAFVNQETANALGIEPRLAYDTLPMHSMWNIVILASLNSGVTPIAGE